MENFQWLEKKAEKKFPNSVINDIFKSKLLIF